MAAGLRALAGGSMGRIQVSLLKELWKDYVRIPGRNHGAVREDPQQTVVT